MILASSLMMVNYTIKKTTSKIVQTREGKVSRTLGMEVFAICCYSDIHFKRWETREVGL